MEEDVEESMARRPRLNAMEQAPVEFDIGESKLKSACLTMKSAALDDLDVETFGRLLESVWLQIVRGHGHPAGRCRERPCLHPDLRSRPSHVGATRAHNARVDEAIL